MLLKPGVHFAATAVSHFKSGKLLDVAKNSIIDSQVKSCFKNFSQRITFTNCCLFCRENTTADLELSLASTFKEGMPQQPHRHHYAINSL